MEPNIVNEFNSNIIFTSPYDSKSDINCKIKVNIKELVYPRGIYYYRISYTNTFSNNVFNEAHPFYNSDLKDHIDGDIVLKNEMTEVMIKYLLMNEDELALYSGNSTPMYYRGVIMKNLAYLWD